MATDHAQERLYQHAQEFTQLVRSVTAALSASRSGNFARIGLVNLVEAVKAGMEVVEVLASGQPGHRKLAVLTEAILLLVDRADFVNEEFEPVVLTLVPHIVNTLIVVKDGKLRVNRSWFRRIRKFFRALFSCGRV